MLGATGLSGTQIYDEGLGNTVPWWAVDRAGTGRAISCILCKCLPSQLSLKERHKAEIPPYASIRVTREDSRCIYIILALQLCTGDGSREGEAGWVTWVQPKQDHVGLGSLLCHCPHSPSSWASHLIGALTLLPLHLCPG